MCRSGLHNIHNVEESFVHYILLLILQGAKIIGMISYPPALDFMTWHRINKVNFQGT